jgi:TRAP-type mannitol/chloroaromatic compound transport system permease large subunit
MMPFMGIQVIALMLLYIFPQIGLWLPSVVTDARVQLQ